jgi:serine/threonine protein kinase
VIIELSEIESLRSLSEGNMGVAVLGRYRDKDVVVKQPKKPVVGQEEWLELQLHMKLPAHPRLIRFIGICMVQTQLYFVTEFVSRGSLKSLLCTDAANGGDALRAYYAHPLHSVRAAVEIAEGLMHLHAHHVVHRDGTSQHAANSHVIALIRRDSR